MQKIIFFEDRKVVVRTWGEGNTALVLLHGFCEDSRMWESFGTTLGKEYFVIAPDIMGLGKSDLQSEASIDKAADLVAHVLHHFNIDKAVVIGHSMGGYVALAMGERHPQHLAGIGLFHSHPFADSEEKKTNRKKAIRFIQKHGVTPFVSHLFPSLFAPTFIQQSPQIVEDFVEQCSQQLADAVIASSVAMLERPDRSEVLTNLDVPTLFILGKQDASFPFKLSIEQTSLAKRAIICVLEEANHMGMFEAPVTTMDAVKQFVDFASL